MKKFIHTLGFILFTIFAYLQLNDATQYGNHDPWIWIILYGVAALFNLWGLVSQVNRSALLVWCGFSIGALLFRMQDDKGNLHIDWINPSAYWNETGNQMVQQTNESGGLVIVLLWALLQLFLLRK